VRNRKPHHHEGPPVGHDDNPRGAIDERRNFDCGRLRRGDCSTRHFGRSTANERQCTPPFAAIRSQHHVGIQNCHERVKVAAVRRREERIDDLSLTSEVGVWSYSERERAALEWTEAVTRVADGHVPDEVFASARDHFSEEELVNLTIAVIATNGWNRLNIAFRSEVGDYRPGMFDQPKTAQAAI
jgi:hypothetical protein